ncbi:MAG: deoxyribonuclease IV [candidate division WOR-3 bacterium]|nr:deoxyribonuclease IV [candidate division WOR-3 bacterium]MCX7757654.1 deoxyribonuclease IV [candidate division WOR-3 bacterium]MDW7987975.1 deoxyribonuclease IV [candidate division WOR-3 bacterium]
MRFGFHISIAGGFRKVVERALAKDCNTIQLFSRNPRGWNFSELDKDDVYEFRKQIEEAQISPVVVHMPYLPNLATINKVEYEKSLESLISELKRAQVLEAQYLVMHIGKRLEATEDQALAQVIKGINTAFKKVKNDVILLLENTAGMGSEVGYNFHQIKTIFDGVIEKDRLGVVLDTAHAFEAGYPIHTQDGLDKTLKEFDKLVGLKRLYLLHLNDSKTDLGSRIDRHWHIGEGKITREGFRIIINHPLLKHLPGIMETPRKSDADDLKNMKVIRSLVNNQ